MASDGELALQRAILRTVDPQRAPVIFDVGANIGDWTAALLEAPWPALPRGGQAHLFEPSPASFRKLQIRFAREIQSGTVVIRQLALSQASGTADLYLSEPTAGTNSLHQHPGLDVNERLQIDLSTLDGYCADQGIEHIDLVKVDVEGHDLAVLRGGSGLLRRQSIRVVQFEYNWRWITSRSFLMDAFELVTPFGYRIGKVTPRGIELYDSWHPELENFHEGNYAAIRSGDETRFPLIPWWNES